VFPDAVGYALAWHGSVPLAAASASRNADLLLRRARYGARRSPLRDLFEVCVAGTRPDKRGLFAAAADQLGVAVDECLVVEDAPAGVAAAVSLGAAAVGVARPPADPASLRACGAGWVVDDLAAAPRPGQ
jgi:beta-phosphoglucomutase-like phosphatase (HAD superfamily)